MSHVIRGEFCCQAGDTKSILGRRACSSWLGRPECIYKRELSSQESKRFSSHLSARNVRLTNDSVLVSCPAGNDGYYGREHENDLNTILENDNGMKPLRERYCAAWETKGVYRKLLMGSQDSSNLGTTIINLSSYDWYVKMCVMLAPLDDS